MQRTPETWVPSLDREDPQKYEMATHFSILAWKIPWAEEPGRPQSMGSQRAGHDKVFECVRTHVCACTHTHTHTHTFIYLVAPRLSCGMWDLVSQLGMEFRSSASGALSLSHWTTRKSLLLLLDVTDTGEPGSMTGVLTAQEDGFSFVQSSFSTLALLTLG